MESLPLFDKRSLQINDNSRDDQDCIQVMS